MVARTNTPNIHLIGHSVLLKFGIQDACYQTCAVYRYFKLLENIGKRADMILMTMGNDNTAHLRTMTAQIGDVRNDEVNTQHFVIRERQTTVNDKDVLTILDYRHVLANLIETAQRYDFQFFLHKVVITFLYQSDSFHTAPVLGHSGANTLSGETLRKIIFSIDNLRRRFLSLFISVV